MVVTGRNKLDPTEINKMVEEAKRNEEDDNRRKQEIEMKNQADNLVYSIEKILKENGDKIPGDLRSKVESLKNDLRDAVNKENIQRIKALMEELNQESMKMGEYLYKQPNANQDQQTPQNGDQNGPKTEDGNTYTAEYEDVK
jgi:molecular chaperone DnaK